MKKMLFALFGLCCLTITVLGQEEEKITVVLKLYTNASRTTTETSLGFNSASQTHTVLRNTKTQVGYFTPALAINKPNGDFHEFEFTRLMINNSGTETSLVSTIDGKEIQTINGFTSTNTEIALRYEYDLLLSGKESETGLKTYLGFGMSPFYRNNRFSTKDPTFFPVSEFTIGGSTAIIPRVNYELNDRFLFDLSLPYSFAQMGMSITNSNNPTLTLPERTSFTLEFQSFPNAFLVRLGVGVRL